MGADSSTLHSEIESLTLETSPHSTKDGDSICSTDTPQEKLKKAVEDISTGQETIQRLIDDQGASVNHQYEEDGYKKRTPLHLLCLSIESIGDDNLKALKSFNAKAQDLLTRGADVNIADSEGNTVLDVATQMIVPADTLEKVLKETDKDTLTKHGPTVIEKLFRAIGSCKRTVTEEHIDAFMKYRVEIFSGVEKFNPESSTFTVVSAAKTAKVLAICADKDTAYEPQLREKANIVHKKAVELMDKSSKEEVRSIFKDDELLNYALDNGLKKFVATAHVQEHLKHKWYNTPNSKDEKFTVAFLRKREYVVKVSKYLLKMLFLPFFIIVKLPTEEYQWDYNQFSEDFLRNVEPVIAFIANAISFAVFLLFLIGNVIINNRVSRCDNLEEAKGCTLDALDWIVFVFVIGLIVQEVTQFRKIKFSEYISSATNIIDFIVLFLFIIYYLLTMTGFYSSADIDVRYQLVRASYHVLGFAALISCIRFLSYLQVHPELGPIQLSFRGIASRVLMFLIILGTFLVGFAVSITSIYSARLHSLGKPANATAPYHVENFWLSLKTMFWVLFGFTDDTIFKTGSDVEDSAENTVGTVLFAVWCVIAIIILLNMLIALICDSFQEIQNNADVEWKFARAWIIRDILEAPLIPIPINLIHELARMVFYLTNNEDTAVSHETSQEDTGTSTDRLPRQQPNDNNELSTEATKNESIAIKDAAMPAKAEKREKQTGMVSGEEAGATAEQATLKGLIVEMTKEFRHLGTRLDALQSRLDAK